MANLLPRQTKIELLWNKRFRTMLVLFAMSIFSLSVVAAALLPVALSSKVLIGGAGPSESDTGDEDAAPSFGVQRQEIIHELRKSSDLLQTMSLVSSLPKAYKPLLAVEELAASVSGVEVQLVTLDADIEGGFFTLRLSGTVDSRKGIVAVRTVFEESADFTVVDFPLGNLTPQGDIYNFIIGMTTESQGGAKSHKKQDE